MRIFNRLVLASGILLIAACGTAPSKNSGQTKRPSATATRADVALEPPHNWNHISYDQGDFLDDDSVIQTFLFSDAIPTLGTLSLDRMKIDRGCPEDTQIEASWILLEQGNVPMKIQDASAQNPQSGPTDFCSFAKPQWSHFRRISFDQTFHRGLAVRLKRVKGSFSQCDHYKVSFQVQVHGENGSRL